jgi:hypothetical protein
MLLTAGSARTNFGRPFSNITSSVILRHGEPLKVQLATGKGGLKVAIVEANAGHSIGADP